MDSLSYGIKRRCVVLIVGSLVMSAIRCLKTAFAAGWQQKRCCNRAERQAGAETGKGAALQKLQESLVVEPIVLGDFALDGTKKSSQILTVELLRSGNIPTLCRGCVFYNFDDVTRRKPYCYAATTATCAKKDGERAAALTDEDVWAPARPCVKIGGGVPA